MPSKNRSDLLSAFKEEAPRPPAAPAPAAAASRRRPSAQRAEAAPRPAAPRRGARAQGDRLNLSFRMAPATWERVKQLALSDRVSVQELLFTALSREFARRGLPALEE